MISEWRSRPAAGRPPLSRTRCSARTLCVTRDALSETSGQVCTRSVSERHPSENLRNPTERPIGQAYWKADKIVRSNDHTKGAGVHGEKVGMQGMVVQAVTARLQFIVAHQ